MKCDFCEKPIDENSSRAVWVWKNKNSKTSYISCNKACAMRHRNKLDLGNNDKMVFIKINEDNTTVNSIESWQS